MFICRDSRGKLNAKDYGLVIAEKPAGQETDLGDLADLGDLGGEAVPPNLDGNGRPKIVLVRPCWMPVAV